MGSRIENFGQVREEAPKLGFLGFYFLKNETLKASIVLRFFRNLNVKMKSQKGVGLTSKYLGIGFGHAGIALTRCRKSSRVVPLQELVIDGQHTSVTLYI